MAAGREARRRPWREPGTRWRYYSLGIDQVPVKHHPCCVAGACQEDEAVSRASVDEHRSAEHKVGLAGGREVPLSPGERVIDGCDASPTGNVVLKLQVRPHVVWNVELRRIYVPNLEPFVRRHLVDVFPLWRETDL